MQSPSWHIFKISLKIKVTYGSLLVALFLTGCASVLLNTEPTGADVFSVSASGGSPVPLGKSPVAINGEKLSALLQAGPALIRASSQGYETTTLLLPTSLRGELKLNLALKKLPEQKNGELTPLELNTLVRDILDAERGIIEKRYDDAQRISVKIRQKHPALAISYFLEGSIQFQKGEIQAAIASLNRGIELDPEDNVTRNFIEQIKKTGQQNKN